MSTTKQPYMDNGVIVSKTTPKEGDAVSVSYNGLLVQSGADALFMHIGYGEAWEDREFIPMERRDGAFHADVTVKQAGTLNLAFKDRADNWDNNSARNYSYKIARKPAAAKEGAPEAAEEKPVKIPKTAKTTKKAATAEAAPAKAAAKKAPARKSPAKKTEKQ